MASTTAEKITSLRFYGEEPKLAEVTSRNDTAYSEALNWYNYNSDIKQARKWIESWMVKNGFTKEELALFRKIPDFDTPTTVGWFARMHERGTKFSTSNIHWAKSRLEELLIKYSTRVKSDAQIQKEAEASASKAENKVVKLRNALLEAAEQLVDAYLNGEEVSMYDFLKQHNVSAGNAQILRDYYLPNLEEVTSDDPQVKEAYGKKLRERIKFWKAFIDDIDRYTGNKSSAEKKPRKPRAKKAVPISKQVSKVKYLKEDKSLKLVSISPENIIGAKQLWLYNTRYKKLIQVESDEGLTVKGTTLLNMTKSVQKTLRKPEITLQSVLTLGKVPLRKVMSDLKTAESEFNGRVNEHTIILRKL